MTCLPQPEPELPQLNVVNGCGGPGERVGAAGGFGEGDDLPDVVAPGQDRNDAVDPEGDAAVRGCAGLQSVQEEPEARLAPLLVDAKEPEDARLHVGAMVTDRAAADLVAVEHEVIGPRQQ